MVVAVPFSAIGDLPREELAGKILIDATNDVPWRDGTIDAPERDHTAASAHVQDLYPDSQVVKAVNHIVWSDTPPTPAPPEPRIGAVSPSPATIPTTRMLLPRWSSGSASTP